jgi:thymidine kinase
MSFKDNIKDWYQIANKTGTGITRKVDKNFNKHLIKPCQMISIIGQTGSGKSQAILEFLSRKSEAFYRIILFTGSTVDEPLYKLLEKHIDGIEMIDNADELPDLTEMNDEDKKAEKLIIFDDIINLPKKQITKIQKWFNSSRKYGYTCIATAQNYTDLPIQIRRNTMIFMIFRLNDMNTINQILKNHNNNGDNKELVKQAYFMATSRPHNFFLLDTTSNDDNRYRHNFLDKIKV